MGKDKLRRFADNEVFENVIQPTTDSLLIDTWNLKGNWKKDIFKNELPITLELACGKGEYTIAMATKYPDRNHIGIDIKGARLWRGAKTALENDMNNVAFLRTRLEFICSCFSENEVSEIWITFPDPQKHRTRIKKRLTHPEFLDRYRKLLIKDGTVNLKTDSSSLFDFTLDTVLAEKLNVVHQTIDVYGLGVDKFPDDLNELMTTKTFYENRWLVEGKKIKFISFNL
ncbi:MAG: tRNA (guanine-N7-)-methyltransferase [Ulvibacter sp.]|jgi:tRNA (guanine-N7-)-methyltransferase